MDRKTKMLLLESCVLLVICTFNTHLIIGFLWVILHEAVHIIVSKSFGLKLYSLNVNLTGAKARIQDIEELSEKRKLILYISGPLFNMMAALILLWIKEKFYINLDNSISINLGLVLFNMLPAYPLDGVRVYELLLGRRILYKRAKKILVNTSFIVAGILGVLFFLTIYIHKVNISLILAAILITYTTFLEKEKTMYIIMGNIIKKRRRLIKYDYIENKSISVYYKRDLLKVLSLIDRNRFNSFFVLDEEMKLLGIVNEDELIEALKEHGNMNLGEFIRLRNEENIIN